MGQEMTVQAGTKEIRIRYNEPCFSPYECDQTLEPDSTDGGETPSLETVKPYLDVTIINQILLALL